MCVHVQAHLLAEDIVHFVVLYQLSHNWCLPQHYLLLYSKSLGGNGNDERSFLATTKW